jgi:hypothetical protein
MQRYLAAVSIVVVTASGGPASTPMDVNAMKSKIMSTAGFQEEVTKLSGLLGCGAVKKAQACASYVQEVAFCMAYADQIAKFESLPGAKEETATCKKIDDRMPSLSMLLQSGKRRPPGLVQVRSYLRKAKSRSTQPKAEDQLAKEMTHDLETNFNKIAPFGKEDTAKELQSHAAKTQDTLVDAVENAEVAEIKRAVFRALTRLRAATIKEFDTIARLETQAIDAYNDAHHYRAENPLAHLHEDEAPVETDKLKSFH